LAEHTELVKATYKAMEEHQVPEEDALAIMGQVYIMLRMMQDAQSLRGVPSDDAELVNYINKIGKELE
jgi:hypothetical protein